MSPDEIAALYVRRDSFYKQMPGVDAWDELRDARNWPGGMPCVAHPPCTWWCRLRALAKNNVEEKALAPIAVQQVQKWGGVLEHPYLSALWTECNLPKNNSRDRFGGYTLALPQFWFGHPANKPTWFYIVGCHPEKLPPIPFVLGTASMTVSTRRRPTTGLEIRKSDRTRTPIAACEWLAEVARRCRASSRA